MGKHFYYDSARVYFFQIFIHRAQHQFFLCNFTFLSRHSANFSCFSSFLCLLLKRLSCSALVPCGRINNQISTRFTCCHTVSTRPNLVHTYLPDIMISKPKHKIVNIAFCVQAHVTVLLVSLKCVTKTRVIFNSQTSLAVTLLS